MHLHKILKWIEAHPGFASWIQAIGAILALGLTVYIAYDASASQEKQAIRAVSSWAKHVQKRLDEEINQSKTKTNDEETSYSGIRAQDLYIIGQTIRGEQLPSEKIADFTELRVIAMQQMAISFAFHEKIKSGSDVTQTDWQKYQKEFEEVKLRFDETLKKFDDN